MPLFNDSESLGAYSPMTLGGRELNDDSRAYVRDVLARVIDEMDDSETTGAMFEPFAKIVNFVLANRKVRVQVDENPRDWPLNTAEDYGPN